MQEALSSFRLKLIPSIPAVHEDLFPSGYLRFHYPSPTHRPQVTILGWEWEEDTQMPLLLTARR